MRRTLILLIAIAAIAGAQTPRYVPENEQQLLAFLVGTTWAADARPEESYVFFQDGRFKGSRFEPTYTITGRRSLMMHWTADTNIPCVFNEACSVMKELGGERHLFVRMH